MDQLLEREQMEPEREAPQPPRPPKRKKNKFKKGFVIYLLVLAAVILIALAVIWAALARYQARLDAETAAEAEAAALAQTELDAAAADRAALQEAFLRFAETTDTDAWVEYYMQTPRMESRAGVEAAISALLEATQMECYKADGWSLEQPVYSIYRDGQPFARVHMEKQNGAWQAAAVEVLVTGSRSGSITVPDGTVVRCGDVVLDADVYAEAPQLLCPYHLDADALRNPVNGRTYTVTGLLEDPEFILEQTVPGMVSLEEGFALALPAEQAKPYQAQASELIQKLVYYYLQGNNNTYANMNSAARLTVYGSTAHQTITGTYDGVTWTNCFGIDYSCETTPGDVLKWADNCYSVDVACLASGSNGQSDKTMDGSYRIFFTDNGAGFGITGLETL